MFKNKINKIVEDCTDKEITKPWPLIDTTKLVELVSQEIVNIINEQKTRFVYYGPELNRFKKKD